MINEKSDLENFLSFESENNCFEYNVDGVFIWDLIRYDLFMDIYKKNPQLSLTKKKRTPFFKALCFLILDCFLFIYYLCFKKWSFLFFSTSRNKYGKQKVFDQNIEDIFNNY